MFTKKLSLFVLPLVATLSLQAQNQFNDPFFNDPFGDDIFKEMMQMQRDMDKMFDRMHQRMQQRSSGLVSPLGTYKMAVQNQLSDKGDHYELTTNIPESKENHIEISTADHVMSITAKIVQKQEKKSQYGVSQSRSVRMYQQSMTLPNNADEGAITTAYKNGKLVVSIGKKKAAMKVQPVTPKVDTKKADTKKEEMKSQKNSETKESNITIKKMILHTDVHEMS